MGATLLRARLHRFKDQATSRSLVLPLTEAQHLAMRRNIEKLCVHTLGARRAHALLPQLPHGSPPGELAALRADVRKLLAHVLCEDEIDAWLHELVDHRFELPMAELA